MTALKIVCRAVGTVQIILGALYLFVPGAFLSWQGLSSANPDIAYPLAMLAARFLVYGVGMFVIAGDPVRHRAFLDGMIAIQAIDLAAGLYLTAVGTVPLAVSAFPMFNAAAIIFMLAWLRPTESTESAARA